MELYFSPLACSLATRITLYELGLPAQFHQVDLATKRLVADGANYLDINPKGQVPSLRTDDGVILTEAAAVLQYIAELDGSHRLAPGGGTVNRAILRQWLNYIATEIHKGIFAPQFNPASPDEAKTFARDVLLPNRYAYISKYLDGRAYILDEFSIADAYLATTLNWVTWIGLDLSHWPLLQAYHSRILERPAVGRAFEEESALRSAV